MLTLPSLYPVLDTAFLPSGSAARRAFLDRLIRDLADAGVTLLQYRAKHESRDQILADAHAIAQAAPATMTLILNDHAHLLPETGFHGLHLGQTDLPVHEARRAYPNAILGLSTHTEAQAAESTEADYVAAGPVFPTASKADAEPAIGLGGLAKARAATAKPLVAIGGITLGNAGQVRAAGADSLAILSALFQPGTTPGAVARDFLRLFR